MKSWVSLLALIAFGCASNPSSVIRGEAHLNSPPVDVREIEYKPIEGKKRYELFSLDVEQAGGRTRESINSLTRIALDRAMRCYRQTDDDDPPTPGAAEFNGGPFDVRVEIATTGIAYVSEGTWGATNPIDMHCVKRGFGGLLLPGPKPARFNLLVLAKSVGDLAPPQPFGVTATRSDVEVAAYDLDPEP